TSVTLGTVTRDVPFLVTPTLTSPLLSFPDLRRFGCALNPITSTVFDAPAVGAFTTTPSDQLNEALHALPASRHKGRARLPPVTLEATGAPYQQSCRPLPPVLHAFAEETIHALLAHDLIEVNPNPTWLSPAQFVKKGDKGWRL